MTDPLYLQIGGCEQWALVRQYHDRSGISGAWGPFPTEQAALDARDPLLEAGVDGGHWTAIPQHKVVGQP